MRQELRWNAGRKIQEKGSDMDLIEVVQNRRSIRAFLPDPVPRELVTKVVDLARWAPSWGNTQPWEVVVADGEKAVQLADAF